MSLELLDTTEVISTPPLPGFTQIPVNKSWALERIPLKTIAEHRYFFRALRKASGKKKLILLAWLFLIAFNFFWFIFHPEPSQALIFDDLSGLGRSIGGGIKGAAYGIIVDIYNGKYGILGWISQTCLFFAVPVATVGIVKAMDDKQKDPFPIGITYALCALVVCLSGGGYIIGQLYLFAYEVLEGFTGKMDDYMAISSAIAEGKGFLASNAAISAHIAECHKFVGQEQVACVANASKDAITTLGDMASTYGPKDWINQRIEAFTKIGQDIVSADNKVAAVAGNLFFMFTQPAMETLVAAIATASITVMSVAYVLTMAFLGLGGPIALLASVYAPGLGGAWVAWVVGVFGVWFWHNSYLAVMWFISKLLISASASNFLATDWFSISAVLLAPVLTGAICGVTGMAVFQGVTQSVSDGAMIALQIAQLAAAVGTGGAAGGATSIAMTSKGSSSSSGQINTAY